MKKTRALATFAVLLTLAVLLQWLSGALRTGFTGYPDEPSHFVTTVMAREYLLQGFPGSPLAFAQDYYRHYPKVGFGHWPPLFYAIASVWTIAAPHSRIWILLLMAGFTAATGTLLVAALTRRYSWAAGVALGAAFVLIPSVQAQTGMVMLDILLTLTALCSALCFARYLETGSWKHSAAFGAFAALTILTKGNGWALALLPPLAIALTGRWRLLRSASLWVAVVPVVLLCLPWQYATRAMADQGWEQPYPTVGYTVTALGRFVEIFFRMSPPLFLLALLGMWLAVVEPLIRRRPVAAFPSTMASLLLAVWFFHSLVPAGVEDRKMIMGLCGLLAFVPEALLFLASQIDRKFPGFPHPSVALACVTAALFFACGFSIPAKPETAFIRAAYDLDKRPDLTGDALVSSDGDGEGRLISELALLEPRPRRSFLRATKTLAHTDWGGHELQARINSEPEMMEALESIPVDLLVIDQSPGRFHFRHHRWLRAVVEHHPEQWRLVDWIAALNGYDASGIAIYRRAGSL